MLSPPQTTSFLKGKESFEMGRKWQEKVRMESRAKAVESIGLKKNT